MRIIFFLNIFFRFPTDIAYCNEKDYQVSWLFFFYIFQVSGKHNIIVTKRVISGDDLEESKSNLYFQVTEKHFTENNSLKVRCTASIYSVYQKTTEISILPDRPNKFIYKPEVQANPFFITFSHNVKSSRSNNAPGTAVFNENNNNVIEGEYTCNRKYDYKLPSMRAFPLSKMYGARVH